MSDINQAETLYEIEREILSALLALSESEEDSEEYAAAKDKLGELRASEGKKLGSIARLISRWSANVDSCKAEAKRLSDKASYWERKIESLKSYVQYALPYGYKWDDGVHSIKWRQTEAVDHGADAPALPEQYLRTKVVQEPNKVLIKQVLKEGGTVPGWFVKVNKRVYFE